MLRDWDLTIGTGAFSVLRLGGAKPQYLAHVPRPTFLTRAAGGIYGVSEVGHGRVFRITGEAAPGSAPGALTLTDVAGQLVGDGIGGAMVSSGGAHPCHISACPDGRWLYVSNYGDGVVRAIELDDDGGFGGAIDLTATGSGPHTARQTGPHAHFSAVVGKVLVIADLGADCLRLHELDQGRPERRATIVPMPPGSGPRHFAALGGSLIVAGELDGSLTRVDTRSWEITAHVPAAAAPGAHLLSHVLVAGDLIIVGVRGANTLSVLDGGLELRQEVATVAWPRHFALARGPGATPGPVPGAGVVVAGERAGAIALHPLEEGGSGLGEMVAELSVPEPMFIGAGEEF